MLEGFVSFTYTIDPGVAIHGVRGGAGPPLLLLHGFPQTHRIWDRVAAQLKNDFAIIAIDLRGYGASSKPSGVEHYAKSAMARDAARIMAMFGHLSYFVCAHDRGARVAHKLCVNYPERVRKAIFLDICPTLAMYTKTDFDFAKSYFHWFFLIQKSPLPETLISGNPRKFLEMFTGPRTDRSTFLDEAWEEYVKALEDPAAVHSMCEDYRASASVDLDEARKDIEDGRKIQCHLRVLWGKKGVIEKCFDALAEWRSVCEGEVSGHVVDSGHYIPEEKPDVVIENIREFFLGQ
ncbi:putative epoxide hydrolase [Mollisia scopiformis]|uniref:Putative epoxide hydrolase n=1 Tax=Mollisia scopiformis TaxID=149040 RepID=A0A194XEU1_MOLSC|nr:putative epoxide hydrolase [Mollisia scopiformis]KUJ18666.1 putative epoxide hydrolase [Mollisia scopiformis]